MRYLPLTDADRRVFHAALLKITENLKAPDPAVGSAAPAPSPIETVK